VSLCFHDLAAYHWQGVAASVTVTKDAGRTAWAARYFLVLMVLTDLVSSVISSASATFFLRRTVPVAASTTSTTLARSLAVSSFPDCAASATVGRA
jgi:hypothetical protein